MLEKNYVNLHFATLDDLNDIDEGIENLISTQSLIKDATQEIINPDTYARRELANETDSGAEIEVDNNKVASAASKIIDTLLPFYNSNNNDNQNLQAIDNLIEEFGPVPILVELKGQLETKIETKETIEFLVKCKNVEDLLRTPGLSIDDLIRVATDVEQLEQPELTKQLDDIIVEQKRQFATKLRSYQQQSKWLSDENISSKNLTSLSQSFDQLIQLQSVKDAPIYPASWWALDILLEPFITRFNYHFDTPNKDTNKLSKPEWAFAYIENFLDDNLPLLRLIVDDVFKSLGRIGTYEVITALLQPMRKKLVKMVGVIDKSISTNSSNNNNNSSNSSSSNNNGSNNNNNTAITKASEKFGRLLSHLIFESSSFDQRLRNKYKYNPFINNYRNPILVRWAGLTGDILLDDKHHTVERWLDFERDLASKRFKREILDANDAFKIDFDYQNNHMDQLTKDVLKPTYSAYGVLKLIRNLNSHFQTLTIVKFQLQYVSKIQLKLLDSYLESLKLQYKDYIDKYKLKSVLKVIPGAMDEEIDKKEGKTQDQHLQSGVTKLTELFCSTKFIINAMENWNHEIHFTKLWKMFLSLQSNSNNAISTKITTKNEGIFGNLIEQYDALLTKITQSYIEFFRFEIKRLLKKYVNSSQWEITLLNSDENGEFSRVPSVDLKPLINALPIYLEIISRSVSQVDYFAVSDSAVTVLCDILYEYILTNNKFTRAGVDQLLVDFGDIISSLQVSLQLNTKKNSIVSSSSNTGSSGSSESSGSSGSRGGPKGVLSSNQVLLLQQLQLQLLLLLLLLLPPLSSDGNKSYVKVVQAIDLLDSIDVERAKQVKNLKIYNHLRDDYAHHLEQLTDSEIKDLLSRLV